MQNGLKILEYHLLPILFAFKTPSKPRSKSPFAPVRNERQLKTHTHTHIFTRDLLGLPRISQTTQLGFWRRFDLDAFPEICLLFVCMCVCVGFAPWQPPVLEQRLWRRVLGVKICRQPWAKISPRLHESHFCLLSGLLGDVEGISLFPGFHSHNSLSNGPPARLVAVPKF